MGQHKVSSVDLRDSKTGEWKTVAGPAYGKVKEHKDLLKALSAGKVVGEVDFIADIGQVRMGYAKRMKINAKPVVKKSKKKSE